MGCCLRGWHRGERLQRIWLPSALWSVWRACKKTHPQPQEPAVFRTSPDSRKPSPHFNKSLETALPERLEKPQILSGQTGIIKDFKGPCTLPSGTSKTSYFMFPFSPLFSFSLLFSFLRPSSLLLSPLLSPSPMFLLILVEHKGLLQAELSNYPRLMSRYLETSCPAKKNYIVTLDRSMKNGLFHL